MYRGFFEEGDTCPECKEGVFEYKPSDPEDRGCYCHICPPCSYCTDQVLTCSECGHVPDEPKYVWKSAGPGIAELVYKPHPLDNTKVDWRYIPHSHISMIKKGVYPEGMSIEDVEKEVKGTFGGRFISFGDGKFEYIAYTD